MCEAKWGGLNPQLLAFDGGGRRHLWNLEKARKQILPLKSLEGNRPANNPMRLLSDFQPPELPGGKSVLFQVTEFVGTGYSSSWKFTQTSFIRLRGSSLLFLNCWNLFSWMGVGFLPNVFLHPARWSCGFCLLFINMVYLIADFRYLTNLAFLWYILLVMVYSVGVAGFALLTFY